MAIDYQIRPITVQEYQRMSEVGVFPDGERLELLDGHLIVMPPIGSDHNFAQGALTQEIILRFADRVWTQSAGSIVVDGFSQPEPDVVVLRGPRDLYRHRYATSADVLLIIEVSKSSLSYDRGRKAKVYARSAIPEYWIVNLVDDCIEIRRDPRDETYTSIRIAHRGEDLELAAFPGERFSVDIILP